MTVTTIARTEAAPAPTSVTTVDIVGCGVFSAAGAGLAPVAAAMRYGKSLAGLVPPNGLGWPTLPVAPVAGFDPAELLGRKGLSRMTRTDQLVMAACTAALDDAGDGPAADRTGVVLGTAFGSGGALLDFLRDTFEQDRPYLVNPSHFPGTLMNSAAGKTAIRHGLTGVNATLSGGSMAAMHALRYAGRSLRVGHATRLLAGGVEELTPQVALAWHRSGALARGVPLGEAAAVFALDGRDGTASARSLGRLLAAEVGFADAVNGLSTVAERLVACVRTALSRGGVEPGDVTVVAPGATGRRGWAAVEERALREVFPLPGPRRLRVSPVLGETHSAGVAMQLAAVLAGWQGQDERPGAAALTSVGADGSVGCLVVAHPDLPEES